MSEYDFHEILDQIDNGPALPELDGSPGRVESRDLDDEPDEPADEQPGRELPLTAEGQPDLDALDGLDGGAVSPAAGAGRAVRPRGVDRYARERLGTIPDWHSTAPPAPVLAAREHLERAYRAVLDAEASLARLDSDRHAEDARIRAEIAEAVQAGRRPKAVRRTSWQDEELTRQAVHSAAYNWLVTARREYDRTVTQAMPAWRQQLREAARSTREAAVEAFAPAAQAFRAWRAAVAAASRLEHAADPDRASMLDKMTPADEELRRRAESGMVAAAELLASEHPVLSGDVWDLPADDVQPPLHVRAWLWSREDHEILGPVEAAEGYSVTDYTRPLAHLYQTTTREDVEQALKALGPGAWHRTRRGGH